MYKFIVYVLVELILVECLSTKLYNFIHKFIKFHNFQTFFALKIL